MNTEEKKQKARLYVEERVTFPGTFKTELTTTGALASKVNALFRPGMADYIGCNIVPQISNNGYQGLYLEIYFGDKGTPSKGQIKNIQTFNNKVDNNNLTARLMNYKEQTKSSLNMSLTQETKEILSDFYSMPDDKIDWSKVCVEVSERMYNRPELYLKVVGLDLNRVLRKMYDDDGDRVEYNISLVRPLQVQEYNSYNTQYLLSIMQLNTNKLEEICQSVGVRPNYGGLSIFRD